MAYSSYIYSPQSPEWWRSPTPAEIYKKLQCPDCGSAPDHHVRCSGCHSFVLCRTCDPDTQNDHGMEACARPNCPHLYCPTCISSDFITQQRHRVAFIMAEVVRSGVKVEELPSYDRAEMMKYEEYRPAGYCVPCYLACTRCENCALFSIPIIDVEMTDKDVPTCEHCDRAKCSKCGLLTVRMVDAAGRYSGCTNCIDICAAQQYSRKRKRLTCPRSV
jgi:hypothetical protein